MNLVDKIRKAREFRFEVEGRAFTLRRPTNEEYSVFLRDGVSTLQVVKSHVVDWEGFTELDFDPGGSSKPVPFDAALWREWVADQPRYWEPIGDAILERFVSHVEAMAAATKN